MTPKEIEARTAARMAWLKEVLNPKEFAQVLAGDTQGRTQEQQHEVIELAADVRIATRADEESLPKPLDNDEPNDDALRQAVALHALGVRAGAGPAHGHTVYLDDQDRPDECVEDCPACHWVGNTRCESVADGCIICDPSGDLLAFHDQRRRAQSLVRQLTREAVFYESTVQRVREFIDGFAARGGQTDDELASVDQLWIMAIRKQLGPEGEAGVATVLGRYRRVIHDLIMDNKLTCDPHSGGSQPCQCSTARALRLLPVGMQARIQRLTTAAS